MTLNNSKSSEKILYDMQSQKTSNTNTTSPKIQHVFRCEHNDVLDFLHACADFPKASQEKSKHPFYQSQNVDVCLAHKHIPHVQDPLLAVPSGRISLKKNHDSATNKIRWNEKSCAQAKMEAINQEPPAAAFRHINTLRQLTDIDTQSSKGNSENCGTHDFLTICKKVRAWLAGKKSGSTFRGRSKKRYKHNLCFVFGAWHDINVKVFSSPAWGTLWTYRFVHGDSRTCVCVCACVCVCVCVCVCICGFGSTLGRVKA